MAQDEITFDAFASCARQSDMARLVGASSGKAFRDVSRRVFGIYVSHGDTLDPRARAFLYAYHVTLKGNADARIALVKAWKDGAKVPPKVDA